MPEEEATISPVFVKQYNLGMSWIHCTHCVTLLATVAARQHGLKVFGGGLESCKLRKRVQHLGMNTFVSCALSPEVMVYSVYLLSTYSCGTRVLSAMGYGVRPFGV